MTEIVNLLANPLVWKILVGYWVFSAFASALPKPDPTSSKGYIFAFSFVNALQGNLHRAAETFKVPGN